MKVKKKEKELNITINLLNEFQEKINSTEN